MIKNERERFNADNPQQTVPASALRLDAVCELKSDAPSDDDTATFRMRARASDSIDHWYWGKIAHDLDGFELTGDKRKLAILYQHDEPVGYALRKHIEADDEGLKISGTFVQSRNSNRATDVIDWMKGGIPFESSISFAGDVPKLENVKEGETAMVNGKEFKGPGVIVRKWKLREASIVVSGADDDTESALFSDNDTVSVTFTETQETQKMSEQTSNVTEDAKELAQSVDLATGNDSAEDVADTVTESVDAHSLSAQDILAPFRRLGPKGLEFAAEGKSLQEATEQILELQTDEIERLKTENAALREMGGGESEAVSTSFGSDNDDGNNRKFPKARSPEESRRKVRRR